VLYLLLKVTSAVGMGLVLKSADARSLDRLPLIRTNYAVAAIIGFFASVALNQTHISNQAALLAAVTGILFVAGLLIWARAIQVAGLALSVVAMRTAVVIPVFAAVLIWHEQPSLLEVAGSFVALLALALVLSDVAGRQSPVGDGITAKDAPDVTTKTQRHKGAEPEAPDVVCQPPSATANCKLETGNSRAARGPSVRLWLLLLFLVEGLVMVPALVFRKELPLNETMPFQTVIFVSAFFVTTMLYYIRRPRLVPETLKWGALLGTANFGNYLFLVMALTALPGLAVYPVIAAGEVGLMAVAGVVLWKEKVGVRSWLGISLAVIAIVLIQLGKAAVA
jgi:drug/metabolite transporter (DMT)-like permease